MQMELIKEIGICEPITVGHCEVFGIPKEFGGGSGNPGAGHGERACVSESHSPILLVIDLVNRNLIGIQFDRKVAVQRWIIQKIGFDDLGFVAKTKHK
jgi:hypothetical protein